MGASYYQSVTKFNNGDYPNANNKEDDIAIITAKLGRRTDIVGNTVATAKQLRIVTGSVRVNGLIEIHTDVDMYYFNTTAGNISLTVTPFMSPVNTVGNNLDIGLALLNGAGAVLVLSEPTDRGTAVVSKIVSKGKYYLKVYATGNAVTPYSVYGSMGQYTITGTVPRV